MREIARHKIAYIILGIAILIMIGLYMAAWPDRNWQRIIAVCFAAFYIFWGVVSHVKSSHLTKSIIYEYLGVGILGGMILLLLTV